MRTLEQRIERQFGRPFARVIWTRHWATFGERRRVAQQLDCSPGELSAAVGQHPWQLQLPPALAIGDDRLRKAVRFGGDPPAELHTADFVADSGGGVPAAATRVSLVADDSGLRFEFGCAEPARDELVARATEPAETFNRAVLDGDVYFLYRLLPTLAAKAKDQELVERALHVPPRDRSVYEDDCVFVRLTPLSVGEDFSRAFLVRDQRDPAGLLAELGQAEQGQLGLQGSFYTVAVNAAGTMHASFFDPWDGGRFWGCWDPLAKARVERDADGWRVGLALPLAVLEPQLSNGAVWGVDIYRHRRARHGQPDELSRTRETILLRFDGDGRRVERSLRRLRPLDEASTGKWPAMWERIEVPQPEVETTLLPRDLSGDEWPSDTQWRRAQPLTPFRDHRTGEPVGVRTEVRLLQDSAHLLARFDCVEPDATPLRFVTREQEIAAFPPGHRAANWLDRREHFGGPKWGDHVEVQLAPGLAGTDRYHNGYYLLLVNARGDLLERYVDPVGAYTAQVAVEDWNSQARTRVTTRDGGWCVEVAIPWASFHCLGDSGQTWFANFRRERAGGRGRGARQQSAWAVPYGTTREPGSFGRMRLALAPGTLEGAPNLPRLWPADVEPDPIEATCDRSRDRLTGLAVIGADTLAATGARGTVFRGNDDGEDGDVADAGHEVNLERVQFTDESRGWAVGGWLRDKRVAVCGGVGLILATDDGGRTWRPQWRAKGPWLYDLHFVTSQVGFVCGGYGTVLKTIDGGATWHGPLATGTNDWLYGIRFADERRGWAVGANEAILHTRDGGSTWQRQTADRWRRPRFVRERLRAVSFADAEHGWAVGGHGTILHTGDGGSHWKRQKLPLDDETADLLALRDVHFVDRDVGWAVGEIGSVVLRTEDGGRHWALESTGFRGGLFGVRAADCNRVWSVGEKGARLASTDGGRTWDVTAAANRPTCLFLTPHDHHVNTMASLFAATADSLDWSVLRPSRGGFFFEPFMDHHEQRWIAGTQSLGATMIRQFTDFTGSRRRKPHFIHHAYQIYGGTEPLTQRLVALIRLLRPEAILTEFPVFAENYWAWETALLPRCAQEAYFASGDAKRFPELSALGLDPWQPAELYSLPSWSDRIYGAAEATHTVEVQDGPSPRLGRSRLDAVQRSMACWEGLMDRGTPERKRWWRGKMDLHLVHRSREGEGLSRAVAGMVMRENQ